MDTSHLDFLNKQLVDLLNPDYLSCKIEHEELTVWVYPASVIRIFTLLSNDPRFTYNQLVDITAVDYPHKVQRFEIVYHLLSLKHNRRLRVKCDLEESSTISSIEKIFPSANWFEREIWDMFGIVFENHSDMRRILTDYGFSGHPLRKDFPLTGFTQTRYDHIQKKVIKEDLKLEQPFRQFDFLSPWESNPTFLKSFQNIRKGSPALESREDPHD